MQMSQSRFENIVQIVSAAVQAMKLLNKETKPNLAAAP
jgi:hypothetical protein